MKIHTVGGYNEVGKNMTAVEVDGDIVIIDMGADMETVIEYEEEMETLSTKEAINAGAVPDDSSIHERKDDVVGIVISHGHLDHTLATPKLAKVYDCPIYATPFTKKIVERIIEDDDAHVNNGVKELHIGDKTQLSDNFELEFVNITHSIPHTPLTVLHTPEGPAVYSCDFKLDEEPTLGEKPDYERIRELGDNGGVKAYIADSTRTDQDGRTKSEHETKIELRSIINRAYSDNEGVIVTTFSSHIARLNNILDANDGRRKVAFIGRSLKEYTKSAEELDLIDLSGIEVLSYYNEVEEFLQRASSEKGEWLIVCTGNQGEPNAVLSRIARGDYHYDITENDRVIFSSSTIPTPVNKANRYKVEKLLRERGTQVEVDVHSHGHGMKEDQRDMIRLLDAEHIIPAHGGTQKLAATAELAREEGYSVTENVHISENGGVVKLD